MGRRTPAQAVKAALDRLLDQRIAAAARLAKIDEEINEIRSTLGIAAPAPEPASATAPGAAKPAMAGPRDPDAKPKTLPELMAEAMRNPAPPGLGPDERPPFQELTQDAVLTKDGLDNVSPSDNMGAGRWM